MNSNTLIRKPIYLYLVKLHFISRIYEFQMKEI